MVRGQPHPRDAQAHDARLPPAGRAGQPGGRRHGQVRGEAARGCPVTACEELEASAAPRAGASAGVSARFVGDAIGIPLDDVDRAIADIAAGRPVIVVDDEDRENEGDIIFAAQKATPELVAFMVRYTSGVICVPMPGPDLDRLALPLMTAQNGERMRTAFTVTVDARDGVTTGISAADRSTTIKLLADPQAGPQDFVKPGHIFPLRYAEGGVLARPGHTEAAVDLARLARPPPARVPAEALNAPGTVLRLAAPPRLAPPT